MVLHRERGTTVLSLSARQGRLLLASRRLQDSDKELQSASPRREIPASQGVILFQPLCASQDRSKSQSLRLHSLHIQVLPMGHRVLHPHRPRLVFSQVGEEKSDRRHPPCSLRSV